MPHWSGLGKRIYGEIASGMYGAILVTDTPRDLAHDHLLVTGGGGPPVEAKTESPYAFVNGSRSPAPLRLTAGETHRLRFVSIHPDWAITYTMRSDSTVVRWRPVAKDGADLPAALRAPRLVRVVMGPGETADFEFRPPAPGRYVIDVTSDGAGWQIPLAVIVEAPPQRR